MSSPYDRAMMMAGISLRNYFATFRTYITAITILLALAGVLIKETFSPYAVAPVCCLGLWICLQWHIATVGTRLTYRYYFGMLDVLRDSESPPRFDPKRDSYKHKFVRHCDI